MASMRLQKYLSRAGVCSRREGERLIQAGQVRINGVIVTRPGTPVDPESDRVEVRGQSVQPESRRVYIALNKPTGYVTSCRHAGEKSVLELVDVKWRVYPVGRLDKDSTGLLLLTNDGELHHHLCHPSFDHEKEYEVTVASPLSRGALAKMARGLPLMGRKTRPARIRQLSPQRFRIVLREGRNRQIRRMVRKVGGQVTALKRIRIADLSLGRLPLGDWRHLTWAEIQRLAQPDPTRGNGSQAMQPGERSARRGENKNQPPPLPIPKDAVSRESVKRRGRKSDRRSRAPKN